MGDHTPSKLQPMAYHMFKKKEWVMIAQLKKMEEEPDLFPVCLPTIFLIWNSPVTVRAIPEKNRGGGVTGWNLF